MIYGPTSSGKTALSLGVADEATKRGLTPVILNADSRQVYTGMDIGTSKITIAEMRGIEHRLLDIADPIKKFSLERYLDAARRELDEVVQSGVGLPIVVGGTATYVDGLAGGWDASGTERSRRLLESEFSRQDPADAHRMLCRVDPDAAARVHAKNYDGVLNALARAMSGGGNSGRTDGVRFHVYGLDRGAAETERRVATVLQSQLDSGLLTEIGRLDARLRLRDQRRESGERSESVVLQTHGYREFIDAAVEHGVQIEDLRGRRLDRATAKVEDHIRAYSRRQRAMVKKLDTVKVGPQLSPRDIVDRALRGTVRGPSRS